MNPEQKLAYDWAKNQCYQSVAARHAKTLAGVIDDMAGQVIREKESPYPDGDKSILACPGCGSGEYLHNEDGAKNTFCGQCGRAIDWEEGK